MESIIQVIKGDQLDDPAMYKCHFCNEVEQSVQLFCVTTKKKLTGMVLKSFGVCKEHLDKLNSLLSGEFNIDSIFLEKYRKESKKSFSIRGYPSITIAKTNNIKTFKSCAFPGCTNKFHGITNRKYCFDERCIELRKEKSSNKPRDTIKDSDSDNLILSKVIAKKIKKGKVLTLKCRARDGDNCRCQNKFLITFEPQKIVYPKYCDEHITSHRRSRFSLRKDKPCQK